MLEILLLALLAYVLGSIPSAVWIGKRFYGTDVREHGSGNAGATNTFRVLGKQAGTIVLLMDVIKGYTATSLVYLTSVNPLDEPLTFINLKLLFGLIAILGHLFPVFAKFKGGKGIATSLGMLIALHYLTALSCLGVFVVILLITRYVSLSSIIAAISFPIFLIFIYHKDQDLLVAFAITLSILVILTHQKNIKKLVNGNENKANLFKGKRQN